MKRRTLFAVALSGILLRASEVLGIEGEEVRLPEQKETIPDPEPYMGNWVWRNTTEPADANSYVWAIFKCR